MLGSLRTLSYIAASLLFILSLRGLSKQGTARRGNLFGAIGMLLAVVMTALVLVVPNGTTFAPVGSGLELLAAALFVGCVVGAVLAKSVGMTSMPELVAVLHSFVGLANQILQNATNLETKPQLAINHHD